MSFCKLFATLSLVLCCALSGRAAQTDSPPPAEPLPATLEAAVEDIVARVSEQEKEVLRHTKREDLILYHHSWGMVIRNEYGLWGGNKALLLSACGGRMCHPDDASMKIIEKVWEMVQLSGDQ